MNCCQIALINCIISAIFSPTNKSLMLLVWICYGKFSMYTKSFGHAATMWSLRSETYITRGSQAEMEFVLCILFLPFVVTNFDRKFECNIPELQMSMNKTFNFILTSKSNSFVALFSWYLSVYQITCLAVKLGQIHNK